MTKEIIKYIIQYSHTNIGDRDGRMESCLS